MNTLRYMLLFLLAAQSFVSAQTSINDYKYIIIPQQFDFQSSEDQYQLNSLTKFLFNKYGYEAYFEDKDMPDDLSKNRCLGLKSQVKKVKGGFLMTKMQINLIDCEGNIIMSSKLGETKAKEYAKAYNLAIRGAFETFQSFDYNYVPNTNFSKDSEVEAPKEDEAKAQKEIERLKKEVKALKENNAPKVAVVVENTNVGTKVSEEKIVEIMSALDVLEAVDIVKDDVLYAQPIDNGFQIVDTEPKKVMVLLDSGVPNMYIVKGKDAVVYKQDGAWVYAENSGNNLKLKVINLKF